MLPKLFKLTKRTLLSVSVMTKTLPVVIASYNYKTFCSTREIYRNFTCDYCTLDAHRSPHLISKVV